MSTPILIQRIALGLVAAAVEFGRTLTGSVKPAEVQQRALNHLADATAELAAAERRERARFDDT